MIYTRPEIVVVVFSGQEKILAASLEGSSIHNYNLYDNEEE